MFPALRLVAVLLSVGALTACSESGGNDDSAPLRSGAASGGGSGGAGIGAIREALGADGRDDRVPEPVGEDPLPVSPSDGGTGTPPTPVETPDQDTGAPDTPLVDDDDDALDPTSPTTTPPDDVDAPGSAPGTNAAGPDSVATIAGLYDFTFENDGGEDITYIEIRADGTFREYDFLGDAQASSDGEFENCYDIVDVRIEALGEGRYLLRVRPNPDSPELAIEIGAALTDEGLSLTQPDGDVTVGTPVSGLSTTDFNACT